MFKVFLTRKAQRYYEKADPSLAQRINRCYERLGENPYRHPNIKRLRGKLSGYFRYRIGNWRVIYEVNPEEQEVIIILIAHRSEVY